MNSLRRLLLAFVVGMLAIAGCGIPSDDQPRALPEGAVDGQGAPRSTSPSVSTPNIATIQ